jgi:hypothetical protein
MTYKLYGSTNGRSTFLALGRWGGYAEFPLKCQWTCGRGEGNGCRPRDTDVPNFACQLVYNEDFANSYSLILEKKSKKTLNIDPTKLLLTSHIEFSSFHMYKNLPSFIPPPLNPYLFLYPLLQDHLTSYNLPFFPVIQEPYTSVSNFKRLTKIFVIILTWGRVLKSFSRCSNYLEQKVSSCLVRDLIFVG